MKWALKAIFLTHYTINCFNVPAIIIDIEAWGQFAECKESQIDIVCRICLMWMNLEIISSISSRITSEWAVRPGNIETSHRASPRCGASPECPAMSPCPHDADHDPRPLPGPTMVTCDGWPLRWWWGQNNHNICQNNGNKIWEFRLPCWRHNEYFEYFTFPLNQFCTQCNEKSDNNDLTQVKCPQTTNIWWRFPIITNELLQLQKI